MSYLQSELYLDSLDLGVEVRHWLDHLETQGLIHRSADEVGPPPVESNESYRLMLLAQIVMQMLERFFIAVGLLQQAGQNRIDRRTLESDGTALARRVSRLYGLNAPEFFDAWLFHTRKRLHARGLEHRRERQRFYADVIGEVRASSVVLPAEFRLAGCVRSAARLPLDRRSTCRRQPPTSKNLPSPVDRRHLAGGAATTRRASGQIGHVAGKPVCCTEQIAQHCADLRSKRMFGAQEMDRHRCVDDVPP